METVELNHYDRITALVDVEHERSDGSGLLQSRATSVTGYADLSERLGRRRLVHLLIDERFQKLLGHGTPVEDDWVLCDSITRIEKGGHWINVKFALHHHHTSEHQRIPGVFYVAEQVDLPESLADRLLNIL